MPEGTRNDFLLFLKTELDPNAVLNKIYAILGNTNIAEAKASVDSDKTHILKMVDDGIAGGCAALDNKVNELIRQWNKDSLHTFLEEVKEELGK